MKLEKLKIENINSFVGLKEIDFCQFENELFLITGETGSGKTTIFDAICAVLYNQTPRLGKNPKDLLNNLSDKAKIELEFSVNSDKFIATWEVKRKKDKTIANIKRSLYKNENQIADKTTEFDNEISKILHLAFEQFTKAIILAQGEFDAFLKAKDSEKIEILEKILPIKEYELISQKVYQKHKEIDNSIKEIDKKIDEIEYKDKSFLDEKILKEKELKDEIIKLQDESKKIEEKIKQITLKNQLLDENQKLNIEIKELETKKFNLEKDINFAKEEFEKIKAEKEEFEKSLSNNLQKLDKAIEIRKKLEELSKLKKDKETQKTKLQQELSELKENINLNSDEVEKAKERLNLLNIYKNEKFDYIDELLPFKIKFDSLKKDEENLNNELISTEKEKKELLQQEKNLNKIILDEKEKLDYLEAKIKVLKYENDRKLLKENEPCPLCGSKNHPYKLNPPEVKENEYKELKKQVEVNEKELVSIQNEISFIEKSNSENHKKLENILAEIEKIKIVFKTKNIKIEEFEELKLKKSEYDKKLKEKNDIETDIKVLNTKIEENKKVLDKKDIELKELEKEISEITNRYSKLLKEAVLFKNELVKIVGDFNDAYIKKDELIQKNNNLNSLYNEKQQKLNEKESEIKTNLEFIEDKEKRVKENSKKLESIVIEDKNYEELKNEIDETIGNLREEGGKIAQLIKYIKEDIKKFENLKNQKNELNSKLKLFTKLDKLIGSADGKKFKKIAIKFMMQELIAIANIHLDKLSNQRYVFEVNEEIEKLDLFVVDKYNENQKRGVATLSGGESFLASLALSFGLSDMIKQKVQIDTLFLDEGFGSLDSNTLNNALNILKEASGGKMIGIISHVDSLKEEISKQIQVIKKGNGRSDLKIVI